MAIGLVNSAYKKPTRATITLSCQLQEIKMEHVVDVSQTMRQEPQSMVKPVVKAR
ncbi:hypothetical protein YC2023_006126 [Brassica napus]